MCSSDLLPLRTWFGYHYQAAVPKELAQRMNAELRKVYDSPSYRTNIVDNTGLIAAHGSIEDFDRYVRNQIRDVRELVANIGLKPE